jgi:hypothetical protein
LELCIIVNHFLTQANWIKFLDNLFYVIRKRKNLLSDLLGSTEGSFSEGQYLQERMFTVNKVAFEEQR